MFSYPIKGLWGIQGFLLWNIGRAGCKHPRNRDMYPLSILRYSVGVNRKLTDPQIQSTCRALLNSGARVTGRALRRELKLRFGAGGNTDRVFLAWRTLTQARTGVGESETLIELRHQVAEAHRVAAAAEVARAEAVRRAVLAEAREIAHQDKWAYEIYDLRAEVQRLQADEARSARLTQQNLLLHEEVVQLRRRVG